MGIWVLSTYCDTMDSMFAVRDWFSTYIGLDKLADNIGVPLKIVTNNQQINNFLSTYKLHQVAFIKHQLWTLRSYYGVFMFEQTSMPYSDYELFIYLDDGPEGQIDIKFQVKRLDTSTYPNTSFVYRVSSAAEIDFEFVLDRNSYIQRTPFITQEEVLRSKNERYKLHMLQPIKQQIKDLREQETLLSPLIKKRETLLRQIQSIKSELRTVYERQNKPVPNYLLRDDVRNIIL